MADLNQPAIAPNALIGLAQALHPAAPGQAQIPPQGQVGPQGGIMPSQAITPIGAAADLGTRQRSFASLYSDPNCDPLWDSAAAIMQRFDPMQAAPLDTSTLLALIAGDPSRPRVYLCCAAVHNAPRIYLVHMLSRYPPAIDGRVTPWDNRICGYLGDVIRESPVNVLLPDSIFDIQAPTLVYDEDTLTQELPNLANDAFFPRGRVQNGNVIEVQTRQLMYLPTRYAPLLIGNMGYTPLEVWGKLLPQLQQDGLLATAAPIVTWLRASLHSTPPQNTGPPSMTIKIEVPAMDQALSDHRTQVKILKGIGAPAPGFEASLATMANALVMQNNEARTTRLANELERDQPTLPSSKFSMLFNSLKAMLNVQEEAQLPEFWFTLAAAPKKQEFSTIRDFLDNYSRSANAFLAVAPIPTLKLLTDLTSATFVADNYDDLKTGLQPFIAMDGSAAYRQATQELARSYTVLAERDVSVTLTDWDNFKVPKDLRSFPINFFELEQNLGVFGNLLGAILGETHPLTVAYRPFWSAFQKCFRARLHQEIDERRVIKPMHILRNIQLLCFNWFHAQKDGTPENPSFLKILEKISLSMYMLPNSPPSLYQLVNPRPQPNPRFGPLIPGLTPTDDMSAVSGSGVSALTRVTGVTSPSGATGISQLTRRTQLAVSNPALDAALQSSLSATIHIKDLIGPDDVPRNEAGSPMCFCPTI